MAETCSGCGASFRSTADLAVHIHKAHRDRDPKASLAMNPESGRPGLVCALCGRRFGTAEALMHHNLAPHPRPRPSNDAAPCRPAYM